MNQFDTIAYLEHGNARQQKAFSVLTRSKIFDLLKEFDPVLVGTIPINIDIESSDLDIICYAENLHAFEKQLKEHFSNHPNFSVKRSIINMKSTVLASFFVENFSIEIFGQAVPVKEQHGYRHMIIEYKLLQEKGETFRQQIIALKKRGYKTEPAFARVLGLTGDPYSELLKLE